MRKAQDLSLKFCMKLCAGITCLILLGIIGYLLYRGIPGISGEFLTAQTSYIKDTVGILPNILILSCSSCSSPYRWVWGQRCI